MGVGRVPFCGQYPLALLDRLALSDQPASRYSGRYWVVSGHRKHLKSVVNDQSDRICAAAIWSLL
jgi:hypothetical protein